MLKTGFLQFEPHFGDVKGNLKKIESALKGCKADLVVLPELATTGYNFTKRQELLSLAETIPDGPSITRLAHLAQDENLSLVVGLAERVGGGNRAQFYNSAVLITPSGYAGLYRKVHLFDREKLFFSPGDLGFPVFPLEGPDAPQIGIMVCWDWRYPESARSLAMAGADVIAHPANLVLPYCQTAMVTRCLENRVFAVTANRTGTEDRAGHALRFTGMSQIVDPDGGVLTSAGEEEERLSVVHIDPTTARRKEVTPHNDLLADLRPDQYFRPT